MRNLVTWADYQIRCDVCLIGEAAECLERNMRDGLPAS